MRPNKPGRESQEPVPELLAGLASRHWGGSASPSPAVEPTWLFAAFADIIASRLST